MAQGLWVCVSLSLPHSLLLALHTEGGTKLSLVTPETLALRKGALLLLVSLSLSDLYRKNRLNWVGCSGTSL